MVEVTVAQISAELRCRARWAVLAVWTDYKPLADCIAADTPGRWFSFRDPAYAGYDTLHATVVGVAAAHVGPSTRMCDRDPVSDRRSSAKPCGVVRPNYPQKRKVNIPDLCVSIDATLGDTVLLVPLTIFLAPGWRIYTKRYLLCQINLLPFRR